MKFIQRCLYNKRDVSILIHTNDNDIIGSFHSCFPNQSLIKQNGNIYNHTDMSCLLFKMFRNDQPKTTPTKYPIKNYKFSTVTYTSNEAMYNILFSIKNAYSLSYSERGLILKLSDRINQSFLMNSNQDMLGSYGSYKVSRIMIVQWV